MTRQIVFAASIVFALIFTAIPARAASRCYPLCSPSLEISMGYVQPTGFEHVGGETRAWSKTSRSKANSSGPSLRVCVFAQSAFFEHAEVVATGLRLTTF
jgi:hypothetical protein